VDDVLWIEQFVDCGVVDGVDDEICGLWTVPMAGFDRVAADFMNLGKKNDF
jgi:hypothetical protein